jgi:hypothetical protein
MDYKSSLYEADFFLGSHVWEDMRQDFEQWLESVRDGMETASSVEELWRGQGRAEAMRFVLKWAENFRDILEENQDVDKR